MSQWTLTDADQRFSSWQMLPSMTSVWNERDLELSFGGLNYSFSLF